MNSNRNYGSILIIKPGAIGDVLQLTPVIRALAARYPDAALTLLVGSLATAQLFRHNPLVHETIVFDKAGEHRSFKALFRFWRLLREKHFDLVINFQRSNPRTWFLALAGFPCTILVYHKSRNRKLHAVTNHLETVVPLGIDISRVSPELELKTGSEDRAYADTILAAVSSTGKERVIALNPGASHRVNRWDAERYAALAGRLANELSAVIVVIGGQEDILLAADIVAKSSSSPLLLAGKTNLLQLAAVLERSSLLITGDTGPMHIATAVHTPVLALFGAADPDRTGPVGTGHRVLQARDVPCVPCRKRICDNATYLACMQNLSVDTVFEAARDMLLG